MLISDFLKKIIMMKQLDTYLIPTPMLEQNELGSVGAQFCFIGNMRMDNSYPWLAYPGKVRG